MSEWWGIGVDGVKLGVIKAWYKWQISVVQSLINHPEAERWRLINCLQTGVPSLTGQHLTTKITPSSFPLICYRFFLYQLHASPLPSSSNPPHPATSSLIRRIGRSTTKKQPSIMKNSRADHWRFSQQIIEFGTVPSHVTAVWFHGSSALAADG